MKSPRIILVVLLMATAVCCWLSVLSLRQAHNQVVLKALVERSGVTKLTEPEVVTRHDLGPVNRIYYAQKFTFVITNR